MSFEYGLNWIGKTLAKNQIDAPCSICLVEDKAHNEKPENKVSGNILIEGESLEILKHLKNTYANRVKMIYIDPPYNTGKKFCYNDKFTYTPQQIADMYNISLIEAKKLIKTVSKRELSHSAWLTFMYPRLYIARELLREDGVIFISIDDNEVAQLKLLCDEVFGEENFVGQFVWKSRQNKDNRNTTGASIDHEYVVCFSKNFQFKALRGTERNTSLYSNPDNDPRGDWTSANMVGLLPEDQRPNCHYDLINPKTGINYGKPKLGWRYDQNTMQKLIEEERILWAEKPTGRPRRKVFLNELNEKYTGFSSIIGANIYTRNGTSEIESLFENRVFDFPKSTNLLIQLFEQSLTSKENDVALDFFGGSGTTAHAVMQLNAEDGGNRQFILVQLPEKTDEKSEAFKAGFKNIAEISKERIRLAGAAIRKSHPNKKIDTGFKSFKATRT
ncbi:site-specific DNA-methyltransferase [Rodentibacter trehalosifermentans]|uniref:site-specific DNA-methyltransferase n=1 Tax=Rodentibacter trehalosifermentans TaxID=1908263 RepID=UPI0009CCF5AD|nr:site-specific DNA-methyltransferase [Rodentibacter trehalosifermentans]OOF52549.1 type III restriction endonuclease subunit M [Rodentibacter trehalosifermentans]